MSQLLQNFSQLNLLQKSQNKLKLCFLINNLYNLSTIIKLKFYDVANITTLFNLNFFIYEKTSSFFSNIERTLFKNFFYRQVLFVNYNLIKSYKFFFLTSLNKLLKNEIYLFKHLKFFNKLFLNQYLTPLTILNLNLRNNVFRVFLIKNLIFFLNL